MNYMRRRRFVSHANMFAQSDDVACMVSNEAPQ